MAARNVNPAPWLALEGWALSQLTSGVPTFTLGGRGTGLSTLARHLETQLSEGAYTVRRVDYSVSLPGSGIDALRSLFGSLTDALVDDLASGVEAIQRQLRGEGRRRLVLIVDRFDLLARVDDGLHAAELLRAVAGAAQGHVVFALMARPTVRAGLAGPGSPIWNLCAQSSARVADADRVRESFNDTSPAVVMAGWRAVGGTPALIPQAVAHIVAGANEAAAAQEVAAERAEWFEEQLTDCGSLARDIVIWLDNEHTASLRALEERFGDGAIDAVRSLSAALLVETVNGVCALSNPSQRQWLSPIAERKRTAARPTINERDVQVYRLISQLEFDIRTWLCERLSEYAAGDWWETCVPLDVRRTAEERQSAERRAGVVSASEHLVDYLQFGDVREIVRLRRNHANVFGSLLAEWETTFESALARLEAIRRKVAHSRPVDQAELDACTADVMSVRQLLQR